MSGTIGLSKSVWRGDITSGCTFDGGLSMTTRRRLLGGASRAAILYYWRFATYDDPRVCYFVRPLRTGEYPDLLVQGGRYVLVTVGGVPVSVFGTLRDTFETMLSTGKGSVVYAH